MKISFPSFNVVSKLCVEYVKTNTIPGDPRDCKVLITICIIVRELQQLILRMERSTNMYNICRLNIVFLHK